MNKLQQSVATIPAATCTVPVCIPGKLPDWYVFLLRHGYGSEYAMMLIDGSFKNVLCPHTSEGTDIVMPPPAPHMPAWWLTDIGMTQLCVYLGIPITTIRINNITYSFVTSYYRTLGRQPQLEQLVRAPPVMVPQAFTLTMPKHMVEPDEMATMLARLYTNELEPWHHRIIETSKCVSVLKHGEWQVYACALTTACLTL